MARAHLRKALFALSFLALASPATGQMFSDGFQFLKAVRDNDGTAVTDALNEPGSVIVNTRDRVTGETALHIVTEQRETVWIRFFLQRGANPNVANREGLTPLQLASNLGYLEGVEALLKGGARVDVSNVAGETPLISAVHRRDGEMMRVLLANGANPDKSDNSGRTARDYVSLMNSNGPLLEVLKKADTAREEAAKVPQSYGPELR